MDRKIRIVMAKPGLDGHDRGIKVLASAYRDAGMEVIYLGLRQTPEMIVSAAVQEDTDVIALSVLSGAHMTVFPKVLDLMKENEIDDVLSGQWAHYIFEMWKDGVKPITDNKIYLNGQSQILSQVMGTADDSERVFNGGQGRICGWRNNNNHRMPVNLQLFRVYDRSLTAQEAREKYDSVRGRFDI